MSTYKCDADFHDVLLTIGHSAHPIDKFVDLLLRHRVNAVGDVRSTPFSRMSPQFNRDQLQEVLQARGIAYVFLGKELGARSQDQTCYVDGRVQYDRLAGTDLFRAGLSRVREGMKKYRLALMCAERDALQCHRAILVGRYLDDAGVPIQHIGEDGTLESHPALLRRLIRHLGLPEHDLFRSGDQMVADAYRIQGERIAYSPTVTDPARRRSLEGAPR